MDKVGVLLIRSSLRSSAVEDLRRITVILEEGNIREVDLEDMRIDLSTCISKMVLYKNMLEDED